MQTEKSPKSTTEDLKVTHDVYVQDTFQIERIGRSFLKNWLPKETLEVLDLDGLTVEGRHFTDDIFKEMTADVVYKVPIKGTNEHVNFFTVVEHKSYQDFWTIFQLWCYIFLICRREYLAAKARGEVNADYRLPPVVAIILHHDESRFQGKTELAEIFLPLPGLAAFLPRLQAILVDLNDIADDDPRLTDPDVPEFKVVLMVLKIVFRQDVAIKFRDLLQELKPYSDDPTMLRVIRRTWLYLTYNAKHLKRSFEALRAIVEDFTGEKVMSTMVEIWKAEGRVEGRAEGKVEGWAEGVAEGEAKGRTEGKAEGVEIGELRGKIKAVLGLRFDNLSEDLENRISMIEDMPLLTTLEKLAFTCTTLDEFARAMR